MREKGIPGLVLRDWSGPGMAQVPQVCADSEGRSYHELPSLGESAYLLRLAFKQLLQLLLHFLFQKLREKGQIILQHWKQVCVLMTVYVKEKVSSLYENMFVVVLVQFSSPLNLLSGKAVLHNIHMYTCTCVAHVKTKTISEKFLNWTVSLNRLLLLIKGCGVKKSQEIMPSGMKCVCVWVCPFSNEGIISWLLLTRNFLALVNSYTLTL